MKIRITLEQKIPLYKKLAPKIRELKVLEMSIIQIKTKLNISRKTVEKSIKFFDKIFKSNLNR
ncbi:MAG: hypothetical protein A3F40_04485 [Chlamydiae bacterium RIFCSPHIGHO2_12_FULL_27_8]|nr:MAG: hypothetical protein A3F40_04485 [Chlamydiae bacterium RIFCSPHIGHO2_12_FULL_27_8]OGN65781.1 MAG: hypothetical protein A2888_00115 [Chlamydiae bacterium RIFCSPLOWO2_01_FULL_28_7]